MGKTVTVKYSRTKQSVTRALYQHDYGMTLVLGDGFPETNEFHFSNTGGEETYVQFGNNRGVRIPDEVLRNGSDIEVLLYMHVMPCDGESVYKIYIPIIKRNKVENIPDDQPIEYIFDGGDSETEDTSRCGIKEYIFDGGDSTHVFGGENE